MSLSQALLLLLFVVHSAIAQSELNGYDMCYGAGTICDAYTDFNGCSSLTDDDDKYWACRCGESLPLEIGCDACQYEYGLVTTVYLDLGLYSSMCSSAGQSIGTIPESILVSISSHTATIAVSKSATFDSKTLANRTTSAHGSTGYFYSAWTSTYGPSMEITPLATAPPSVQDNPPDGNGGKSVRNNMLLVGGAFILGVGLLLG